MVGKGKVFAHLAGKEEEAMAELFQRMADGESVSAICRSNNWNRPTINLWTVKPRWREEYYQAREALGSYYADRIIEEAVKATECDDHAKIAGLRLLVDSLKWTASKLNWRVYGDRVDVTSLGEKLAGVIALPAEKPEIEATDAEFEIVEAAGAQAYLPSGPTHEDQSQ